MKTKIKGWKNKTAFVLPALRGLLVTALGFLVSNATVLGSFSPFGISLAIAVPLPGLPFAMVGSLAGYLVFGGVVRNGAYLGCLLVASAARFALSTRLKDSKRLLLINSVMVGITLASLHIIAYLIQPVGMITFLLWIAESALCGCVCYMVGVVFASLSKKKRRFGLAEQASLAVLGVLVFVALSPVELGGMQIARVLGVTIICLALCRYGYAGGSTAAILFTISSTLFDPKLAISAGCLIVAAFIGGIFQPLGRMVQLTMFIATTTLTAMVLGSSTITTMNMLEVFLGCGLFVLLPNRMVRSLQIAQPQQETLQPVLQNGIVSKLNFAANTLLELQDSIEQVSDRIDRYEDNDLFQVYTKASDKVCKGCGLNTFCWVTAYSDVMNSLNDMTKTLRTEGEITKQQAPYFFQSKCCQPQKMLDGINHYYREFLAKQSAGRRVSEARTVAIQQLEGVAEMLGEMGKEFGETARLDPQAMIAAEEVMEEQGYQPEEISCFQDQFGHLYCDVYLKQKPGAKRLTAMALALGDRLDREFDPPSTVSTDLATKVSFFEHANFKADFFGCQIADQDNQFVGDSYEYFSDSKGYAHMILSDGMGSGPRAAVDSTMTCSVTRKLLQSGFGMEAAFRLVNLSFLVKSKEESLATLDLCSVDLYTGLAEFTKAGAAASFVFRGNQVVKVESSSLPIGILPNIRYDRTSLQLGDGDVVLLVSDGVLATGEEWVKAELELRHSQPAVEIARKICTEAKRRRVDGHSDDISVLALKLSD